MTRAKRPILALIIACLSLASVGVIIWQIPPSNLWIELGTMAILLVALGLGTSWLFGRKKTSFIAVSFLFLLLLLSRFGALNWITFGLVVAVLGLISLIN